MDESSFRRAVRQGLGRAILYARGNDVSEYREVILDALLNCYSVDVSSEGTRAPFMYDLVSLLPNREFYRQQVLGSLEGATDSSDGLQRFRIATYLAMDGDEEARTAAYRHFTPGRRYGVQTALGFVELDGMDGFLFCARKLGALLRRGEEPVDLEWLSWHAEERFGEHTVSGALEHAADGDPDLQAFRVRVLEAKAGDRPQVGGRTRDSRAEVIPSDFRRGDHQEALRRFEQEEDPVARHQMGKGLRALWEAHPDPDSEPRMLRLLYELGPCSMCREFVVARLIELGVMTEELRAECAFDANDEVRKMVGAE